MSDNRIVSGDAMAVAYSAGQNSQNRAIAELVAENERLRGIIAGLECSGDHCMVEPVTPVKYMCQVCRAKKEAGL